MPRVRDQSDWVRGYAAHDKQGFAQGTFDTYFSPEDVFVDSGERWHKGYSDDQFPFNIYWWDGGGLLRMQMAQCLMQQ